MQITIVVSICHALTGVTGSLCHEEIVARDDMPMQACLISQPAIAEWKSRTIYRGDQWRIERIRCIPGVYEPKDAI